MRLWITLAGLALLAGCQVAQPGPGKVWTRTASASDSVVMEYNVTGAGDTAVVFIHCWCCNRRFWDHQLDALDEDYLVVAMDLPGHGTSGAEREEWTIDRLGADVQSLVEQMQLRRVILVGHSMGGPVAVLAAKRMPERVLGIILVDTMHDFEFEFPRNMADQYAQRFADDFPGAMNQAVMGMFPPGADRETEQWVVAEGLGTDRTAAVALMRDFPNLDLRGALRAVRMPIRAINAAPDPPRAMATKTATNRKYADYDVVLMEGVGHYLQLERPGEFNTILREFVDELAARGE